MAKRRELDSDTIVKYAGMVIISFLVGGGVVSFLICKTISFFSGLSFTTWALTLILLWHWLKLKKEKNSEEDMIGEIFLILGTALVAFISVALYLAIILWPFFFEGTKLVVLYAILITFSGFQVFLLGKNSDYLTGRDTTVRHILSMVTLVSLTSIAVSFALSSSYYKEELGSTGTRAIVFGSYSLLPVAVYSLGYVAKQLKKPIMCGLALLISLFLAFSIGTILISILSYNRFFFSAGATYFLTIGLFLAIVEIKGRSGDIKE